MEKKIHRAIKEFWREVGLILGFNVKIEYNIDGNYIDVVWEKDKKLIFIEIENSTNKIQVLKNMTKALHLKPEFIIFDCLNDSIAEYIESKKRIIKNTKIKVFRRSSKSSNLSSENLVELAIENYNNRKTPICRICKKMLMEGKSASILVVHPACYLKL